MKEKLRTLAIVLIGVFSIFSSQDFFAQTQKNPLIEFCTGTWCQWCPCGDVTIDDLLAAHPNLIPLAYHGPAGQDPYSIFPGNEIIGLMGFSGYPTATVNRASALGDYTTWTSKVNAQLSAQATVTIDIQRSFNEITGELNATIDVTPLEDLTGQYKYNIVLTEDSLIYNQINNNACVTGGSNWVHDWVVRAMINGASGENLNTGSTWGTGNMISKTVSYNVPLAYNADKCNLVVFVYKQSSPMYLAEVQQAEQITLVSPDYVATLASKSSDVIGENNTSAEFTLVLRNIGLLDDTYEVSASIDAPSGWMGQFTTSNGTYNFGETNPVFVASGDSTIVNVTVSPNGIAGSGLTDLQFASQNDPGTIVIAHLRNVTTTGVEILVIDASGEGYGELVSNSVANVFSGSSGIVSSDALNPSVDLDNFQMISWSAGNMLPVFLPDEVNLLQGYLDGVGKLFINGQDIGADVFGSGGQSQFAQGFYNNYLHASFLGDGNSYLINGIASDPITNGISFIINDIYPRSPDNIAPYDASASSIFTYLNGPNIAGIKAATTDYQVVYFGFGFEQITSSDIRDTLVSRIINYFSVEPAVLPLAPVLLSPANSEVIDSSSVLFVWQQSLPQVSKYSIELDTTDQFSSPIVNSEITDTTYLFTGLLTGKNYWWRVRAFNSSGWGNFSEVRTFSTLLVGVDDKSQIPTKFSLEQNYPNPFNPSTTIAYSIPKESQVSLKIYDVMGREVVEVVNGRQSAGDYNVEFDAASLASGTYFYKLTAGEFISVKKMILLK